MQPPDLKRLSGRRVTVLGLGRRGGGLGATKFLVEHGARVSVIDALPREELAEPLESLKLASLERVVTGRNVPDDLEGTELLVVNPAVRPDSPMLAAAQQRKIPMTSEVELLCAHSPARLLAVTGSNGKSTTASLVAHLLRAAGETVWLGGNIGGSLLDRVQDFDAGHWVVLELSSFQLTRLRVGICRPEIGVVTGFAPNHLDWHPSEEHYRKAKQRLLELLAPTGIAVLNADDPDVATWPIPGNVRWFGRSPTGEPGVFLDDAAMVFTETDRELATACPTLRLPGAHNQCNALAAACAVHLAGVTPEIIVRSLPGFRGLPQRLEPVATAGGRQFINDSVSTTPESTMAACRAFRRPLVLIAGGADKGADLTALASCLAEHAKFVALMGDTAASLKKLLEGARSAVRHAEFATLDEAFAAAVDESVQGDIVMLSPGCASYGLYSSCEERGQHFERLVREWVRSQPCGEVR